MIKRFIITSKYLQGPRNYSSLFSDNHHEHLISLLQSCEQASRTAQIHGSMVKTGLDRIPFPLSKLLARVSKQDLHYASSIFKRIETPNLYMFNTMLRAHSTGDDPRRGLVLFNRMRVHVFVLDQFTFVSVLKCCSSLTEVRVGLEVHSAVLKSGFDSFLNVENALMHFYCVCGRTGDAHQVFDELCERRDLVSWNTLMGGYLRAARHESVVRLLKQFLRVDGFRATASTVLNVLSALEELRNVAAGECLHAFCLKVGFLSNLNVLTSLISLYGKNGRIRLARLIFDEVDVRKDVVLWNCLIDGCSKSGLLEEALELLKLMKQDRMKPNSSTLASLLSACSASGGLAIGQYVHSYVEEQQLAVDVVLGTALVDMYAKNGSLEKAIDIFDKIECKDVRCWTTMISSYGAHGQASRAVALFERMEEGFRPNDVTFLAVLNSCSHGGLVAEGMKCLKRMVEVYGFRPNIEHYGCVIDLLGRAGLLDEAYWLIKGLPVKRDGTAWRALLGACRVYGDVDLAERVKEVLEEIGEECPSDGLALTGAYAVAGMLPYYSTGGSEKGNDHGRWTKKEAGCSTIELGLNDF